MIPYILAALHNEESSLHVSIRFKRAKIFLDRNPKQSSFLRRHEESRRCWANNILNSYCRWLKGFRSELIAICYKSGNRIYNMLLNWLVLAFVQLQHHAFLQQWGHLHSRLVQIQHPQTLSSC